MSEIISFPLPAGPNFTIPDVGELNWGQEVTNFLVAIPHGVPPTAGTFTLTGDLSFGPSFGLVSKYLISGTTNPSTTGFLRLAKTDTLSFRNNANTADIALGINNADQLTFNGAVPAFTGAVNNGTQYQLGYYAANGGVISGLTLIAPSSALVSDSNGLPIASSVSAATLAFMDATSSVQTQINAVVTTANAALPKSGGTMTGAINMGSNSITNLTNAVNPQDAVAYSQVSGIVGFQSGDLKAAAYASTPSGWLLCDGTSYATATYPALFAAIGYAYGGAGANFNVPNLVNYVPVGQGGSIAPSLGAATGATTTTVVQNSHTHTDSGHQHTGTSAQNGASVTIPTTSGGGDWPYGTDFVTTTSTAVTGSNQGSSTLSFARTSTNSANITSTTATNQASTTVQPSLGVNWFIKI